MNNVSNCYLAFRKISNGTAQVSRYICLDNSDACSCTGPRCPPDGAVAPIDNRYALP
jgi:hypothetical protein